LIIYSRRLKNPAGLRRFSSLPHPSSLFFFSEFLVRQMRGGVVAKPLYSGRGGGRRATGPPGIRAQIFCETFCRKAPAARQRGGRINSCKLRKQKYIFVKNEIEKYKNIKIATSRPWHSTLGAPTAVGPAAQEGQQASGKPGACTGSRDSSPRSTWDQANQKLNRCLHFVSIHSSFKLLIYCLD